ncbi:MAG TPA: FAD-dependent oxidoreductase, partial [Nocardioides sp.]|nr:FAD-dependent oxidoreductase [Nocardioides sp.]
ALLAARGVRVVDGVVVGLVVDDDRLTGARLADGTVVPCGAIAVATLMRARTDAVADLGLKAVPHPSGVGEHIPADPSGQTEVPGVWAAGNVTDMTAQVGASAAAGATAGARINYDLILEDAERQRSTLK